jgi:hypothetical protein
MISVGKWRWPLIVALPLVAGVFLVWRGVGRLCYEGTCVLAFSGDPKQVDRQLSLFLSENVHKRINLALSHPSGPVTFEKVPGHPLQISIKGQGDWPTQVVTVLDAAAKVCVEGSLAQRKAELQKELEGVQMEKLALEARMGPLASQRKALLSSSVRKAPRGDVAAKIKALQARRKALIERYPTHTDIPLLAKQIQELQSRGSAQGLSVSGKLTELGRQANETKVRIDYLSRQLQDLSQVEKNLKPAWKVITPGQKPSWPVRMEQWPFFSGVLAGVFLLGFLLTMEKAKAVKPVLSNGLWRPEMPPVPAPDTPVELTVVSAEPALPSDPLTEKAAMIYTKWTEVAKVLYTPAPEPPQGVLDSVGPLLQESSEFLAEGHDVLARVLAHSVAPGDLPAHVARTVLMTLAGADEAGASPEHRLAMALAALFHDLAVVPRPPAIQEEVGSEVGRLSASVLRRIPGLQPAILSMVEEILIGMDEFKLETWQNVATGKNLEPLSKVLREIDRFEKVMQKQKSRLNRQVAHRKAG